MSIDIFAVARRSLQDQFNDFSGQNSEFIPYACHYNAHTVLCKNGTLVQTIRLIAFTAEFHQDDSTNIRAIIRDAIEKHHILDEASIWFHTVRASRDLFPHPVNGKNFPDTLHQAWSNKNYWHSKFVNEIYISFVIRNEALDNPKHKSVLGMLAPGYGGSLERTLAANNKILEEKVNAVLGELAPLGASRLQIEIDADGPTSQFLQFISRLIYLDEKKYCLPTIDLCEYLATHHTHFGRNSFEIATKEKKLFAAILGTKEYQELLPSSMDNFLQLPFPFVITQFIERRPLKEQIDNSAKQDYYLQISKDEALESYFKREDGTADSEFFCSQQTTIMIIANSQQELTKRTTRFAEEISSLGMLVTREDLALEDCFWAQLPGSFEHVRRLSNIPRHYLGGYAQLFSFSAGQINSPWGHAVTILRTAKYNPFFFSFHAGGAGNTCLFGNLPEQQLMLQYFLLAEAQRISDNQLLLYVDHPANLAFLKAMRIPHLTVEAAPCFAFLHLSDATPNQKYFTQWLALAIPSEISVEELATAIEWTTIEFFKILLAERNIAALIALINTNPNIEKIASFWVQWLTALLPYEAPSSADPTVTLQAPLAISLHELEGMPEPLKLAIMVYLIHRMVQNANPETRTIVWTDNLRQLCELCGPRVNFVDIMLSLNSKNTVFFSNLKLSDGNLSPQLQQYLTQSCDTLIFFEDKRSATQYQDLFGLGKADLNHLNSLAFINRLFIVKQANVKTVIELNITGMAALRAILTGEQKAMELIDQQIANHGPDPVEWLEEYIKAYEGQ